MGRKREKETNGEDAAGEEEEAWGGGGGGADTVLNLLTSEGSSISIRYHSLFGSHDDLILLEVDDELLPDVFHHR